MKLPIISIISPVFNADKTIEATIASIQKQEYGNWEAIFIDDGSFDNSLKILKTLSQKDTRIKYFSRDISPKGASTCRNIGLEKAKGEYIIFLDADDLLAPWCLEKRCSIMLENNDLDFAVFKMKYFKEDIADSEEIVNNINESNPLIGFLKHELPWVITCPIWKKAFLLELAGFNEFYPRLNDPELHTRALLKSTNFKTFYNFREDCYYRMGEKFNFPSYSFCDKHFTSCLYYMQDMPKFIDNSPLIKDKVLYKSYLKTHLLLAIKSAVEWNQMQWAYKLLFNAKKSKLVNFNYLLKKVVYINMHSLSYKSGFYKLNILRKNKHKINE